VKGKRVKSEFWGKRRGGQRNIADFSRKKGVEASFAEGEEMALERNKGRRRERFLERELGRENFCGEKNQVERRHWRHHRSESSVPRGRRRLVRQAKSGGEVQDFQNQSEARSLHNGRITPEEVNSEADSNNRGFRSNEQGH